LHFNYMPRLSLGLGAQNIRKVGAAAPSGIVVATTNTINVVDTFGFNQTISLSKISSTLYRSSGLSPIITGTVYCAPTESNVNISVGQVEVQKAGGEWYYRFLGSYNCDGDSFSVDEDKASVSEITSGIIPTSGWSPNLTITAA